MPEAQTVKTVQTVQSVHTTCSVADRPAEARSPAEPRADPARPFHEVHSAGDRVEALLGELGELTDPATRAKAEGLVRALIELYGGGLERILQIIIETDAAEVLHALTTDDLVSGLLILHDLHPLTTDERVREALDEVRPYLGSHAGGVDLLGITSDGVVRLRLQGTCDGCPSSRLTVTGAIERAIAEAAPEISRVEVEGLADEVRPQALLQIGHRPPGPCPVPEGAAT
ncbi:NifU family protein [Actinomadura sp. HBU206391]|uniref:NifU family protein n=1 Tax=Actinomadura sp. HBU206391 TaxID=2731692 RepID=UPI0016502965|nr:NifU family protein [Actinomadura sp. HBU206391]MBC6460330.1 NifU family protein [Actinomadura sp. HBU206391]